MQKIECGNCKNYDALYRTFYVTFLYENVGICRIYNKIVRDNEICGCHELAKKQINLTPEVVDKIIADLEAVKDYFEED